MSLFIRNISIKIFVFFINIVLMSFVVPLYTNAETLAPTLGNDSIYIFTQGSEADYTYKVTGEDGVEYYKVDLNTDNMNNSASVEWQKSSNTVDSDLTIQLPHNSDSTNPEVKSYDYTYTMPTDYTQATERVTDVKTADVENVLFEDMSSSYDAVIYNKSDNSNVGIIADFVGNYISNTSSMAWGTAIENDSNLGNISGVFLENYIYAPKADIVDGGVIYNNGLIGDINADFINNNIWGGDIFAYVEGGVINNTYRATINSITGNFIGNSAKSEDFVSGGAILNAGLINSITGCFVNNYALGESASGGAISMYTFNDISGTIMNISADFFGNYAESVDGSTGGAIENAGSWDYYALIDNIEGDFVGNYVKAENGNANGGAITNQLGATINSIKGDFIGNYSQGKNAYGGAIYNNGNSSMPALIDNIEADFVANYTESSEGSASGGAIYNIDATINSITGDFKNNFAESSDGSAQGGAIYNEGTINFLSGKFVGNYAQGNSVGNGGAISNAGGTIGVINADFINNRADSEFINQGGAISNGGIIDKINGSFVNNYVSSTSELFNPRGGAIFSSDNINSIVGNFSGNHVISSTRDVSGGAIHLGFSNLSGSIKKLTRNIKADFIGNYAVSTSDEATGGALYLQVDAEVENLEGDFLNNYVYSQGSHAQGGAIYNTGQIDKFSSSFIGNYAKSEANTAQGGAIYTTKDLNFVADNKINEFTGNYVQVGDGEKQYEAIYVDSKDATLTFEATNDGRFVMNDYINGQTGYDVKLTGDGTGTFELNNQLKGADVITENITVDLTNGEFDDYEFNSLNSSADTKYALDVDFDSKTSDTITTTNASTGVVTIDWFNAYGDLSQLTTDDKIKILNTQNSDLQLAFSQKLQDHLDMYGEIYLGGELTALLTELVKQSTNWDDTYSIIYQSKEFYGGLALATTTTTNDSIALDVKRTEFVEDVFAMTDTLAYVNQNDGGFTEREFNFDSAENVYSVNEALGETVGKLTINGVADGENKSTIDFKDYVAFDIDGHSGFEVVDGSELNINNLQIKNAATAVTVNTGATASFNNVDFIDSFIYSPSDEVLGGAIHNEGEISVITGDFVENYAKSTNGNVKGGAIYIDNYGTIGAITGDFIGNSTFSYNDISVGGAIYSKYGTIGSITGDFIDNYAESHNGKAFGGAIYNYWGTIGSLTGDFIRNHSSSITSEIPGGGAIYNGYSGIISSITGDFIDNYVSSSYFNARGGAIYNYYGTIDSITGDFINNYAESESRDACGGSIYNYYSGAIDSITGDFIGNYVSASSRAYGGAIHNVSSTIFDITGDFKDNYAVSTNDSAYGGAIYNYSNGAIANISGNFVGNYVKSESGNAYGGAIYNVSSNALELKNTSFINNYALSSSASARGGAIYSNVDVNLVSYGGYTSLISGNYVIDSDGKRPEAISLKYPNISFTVHGSPLIPSLGETRPIFSEEANNPVSFNIVNLTNSKTIINDKIVGESYLYYPNKFYYTNPSTLVGPVDDRIYIDDDYNVVESPEFVIKTSKLNITGDGTGLVQMNNDVINMDVSLTNSTLHLGVRDNVLDNNNLTLNSGSLSMVNNQAGVSNLTNLTVSGNTDVLVDVDLANSTMDRISADSYGEHNGNLNVVGMNLLSDATGDKTSILFAENGLKDNVTTNISEVAYTPIYKYNVSYDNSGENGYFVFNRFSMSGSSGNSSDAFNPAILGGSTSAAVGAVGTMNQAVNYSFNSVDSYMNIPYMERMAMKRRNHYALAGVPDDVRQLGRYSPLYLPGDEEESVWVKPYSVFESVPLKNGPKVSNISYGTLVGFDSQMKSIGHGWDRVISGYVGYTGASQRYSGVDSVQNGGLLGGTMTLYRGNFFNATTLNVGASVAQNETMYGKDDYTMLMSGIANKSGYNIEFKDGKLILQPSMLVGYTFVNTFDYTNAAGVKIDNKPLHTLQLSPSVKLIGNLKDGWQPYASVGMVWNLMGESDATANGVKLPEMSIKPYVQYGVGVQKRVKDHFMAYGQAMIQNGGRNGISLTAGFRWALGHDKCAFENSEVKSVKKVIKTNKNKKVEKNEVKPEKKVLKEMSNELKLKKQLASQNSFKLNSKTR